MDLHYYIGDEPNFGDDINPWFWEKALGFNIESIRNEECLVGIGTILNDFLPQYKRLHILGSGAGYGNFIPQADDKWKVYFVRGPITAKHIGVDNKYVISDPVILINSWTKPCSEKLYRTSFIPHVAIDSKKLKNACRLADVHYISPKINQMRFIEEINHSEKVITSAMHGAIVADALRVPWSPVITSGEILSFKWHDFCASMELEYLPSIMTTIWPEERSDYFSKLKNIVKTKKFYKEIKKIEESNNYYISRNGLLESKISMIEEALYDFKKTITKL